MTLLRKLYGAGDTKAETIFRVAVVSYFLSALAVQAASVLPGRSSAGRNSTRRPSESFLQTWKSVPQKSEGPPWNTRGNNNEFDDRATFREPEVMDKPGYLFPDDISPWTSWSTCSGDAQTRTRGPPEYAKQMRCGHLECVQTRPCRVGTVTRSLQWGGWGQWSECVLEADRVATRTRVRQCGGQPERADTISNRAQNNLPTSLSCIGQAYETMPCEVQIKQAEGPEWLNWGPWSNCERGSQSRTRNCKVPSQCPGATRYETQACLLPPINSVDRTWGQRILCSSPSQYNARYCGAVQSSNGYQRVRTSQQRAWRK